MSVFQNRREGSLLGFRGPPSNVCIDNHLAVVNDDCITRGEFFVGDAVDHEPFVVDDNIGVHARRNGRERNRLLSPSVFVEAAHLCDSSQ